MHLSNSQPFYTTIPLVGDAMEYEKILKQEQEKKMTYFSEYVQTLQKRIEGEADQLETSGSIFYDQYPDKAVMRRMADNIWKQWEIEFPATVSKDEVYMLLVWEIFRRRDRFRRGKTASAGL